LDPILPKVAKAGVIGGVDVLSREGLADGDQGDRIRSSVSSHGCICDAIAYISDPPFERSVR
jgi:hypothetical protein